MDFLRESIYFSPSNESTLYGSLENDNSSTVVSDYVHNLANGVYKEFESLILHHGENVVKNLMPMVVSCLETMDRVYSEKHNIEVEFELLKEDSSQLMIQYEREKNQRKNAEEDLFKSEDNFTEASKKYEDEIQKLKSTLKMHEIRLKNSQEQITRFDKRDTERQSEFDKLLSRYHEVVRYNKNYFEKSRNLHVDMEKTLQSEKVELKPQNQRCKSILSKDIIQNNSFEVPDIYYKHSEKVNEKTLSEELGPNLDYEKPVPQIFPPYEWDLTSIRSDEENCVSDIEEISTGTNILPLDDELADMSCEIESIIKENNDLIATKNALNIVKDDLISKLDEANSEIEILQHENNSLNTMKTSLKLRINDLEIENKGLKQEVTILQHKKENENDEENIPMSQRKRFTRLEMARVLMERNQYKEKLMEMEEYIKWIKMLKNKKEKRLNIWERFSRLFSSDNSSKTKLSPNFILRHDISVSKNDIINKSIYSGGSSRISNCEALKDPDRPQINGWSLSPSSSLKDKNNFPIPIYCRPLLENEFSLKSFSIPEVTCAVAVNMAGGSNLRGDMYVGSSIFYDGSNKPSNPDFLEIEEKINQGYCIKEYGTLHSDNIENRNFNSDGQVWICTSNDNQSQILIIDAGKPADVLESFIISSSPVQCLASIPGSTAKDYIQKPLDAFVDFETSIKIDNPQRPINDLIPNFRVSQVNCIPFEAKEIQSMKERAFKFNDITITRRCDSLSNNAVVVNPDSCDSSLISHQDLYENSTIQPTIWIGCRNGDLFVHPATGSTSHCIHHIRLSDSITNIMHQNSRVFVSLANGCLVIFGRYLPGDTENANLVGEWQMSKYILFEPDKYNHSIRCLESVTLTNKVWIGFKNQVIVIDDVSISISTSFEVHPRSDYTVRQMCCAGDGVWISLRLDTTLRLFHCYNYQHLQDLNVEPHINKLIEPSLIGLSLLRITCLSTSCHRLWIGTNKGMIISAPFLNEVQTESQQSTKAKLINDLINNYENLTINAQKENLCSPTFIPYINHEDLQLSYHGHRDTVKFFITVLTKEPDTKEKKIFKENSSEQNSDNCPTKFKYIVMSGGEGYKDFRLTENILSTHAKSVCSKPNLSAFDITKNNSHLIAWQLSKKIV